MTKPNLIPEKITILNQAKEEIRKGYSTGLCNAISSAKMEVKYVEGADYETISQAAMELSSYVQRVLNMNSWLPGWQKENGFERRSVAQQRQDRMDWIDWMIKCYREDLAS